jgi:hypothetical protein
MTAPRPPDKPSWRERVRRHIAPWIIMGVVGILMITLGGLYVILTEEFTLGVVLIAFGLLITGTAAFVAGF